MHPLVTGIRAGRLCPEADPRGETRKMTSPAHRLPDANTLSPLGVPAILLAVGLLFTPLLVLDDIPEWTSDYGVLVYPVFVLYVAAALRLLCWGVALRREDRRSGTRITHRSR